MKSIFAICALLVFSIQFKESLAQDKKRVEDYFTKIGIPSSSSKNLTEKGYYFLYHFKPKRDRIKAYENNKKLHFVSKSTSLRLYQLYEGEYKGRSGKWGEFCIFDKYSRFVYIFLEDLKDNEKEYLARQEKVQKEYKEKKEEEDLKKSQFLLKLFFLFLFMLGFLIAVKILFSRSGSDSEPNDIYAKQKRRDEIEKELFWLSLTLNLTPSQKKYKEDLEHELRWL